MADQPRLSLRALNRATLDRQLLLRLDEMPAQQAISHLGGLQAQAPLAPYVGLWTRLADFTTDELSALLSERTVVRAPIMRATVHLADTADFVAFRPLFGSLMAAGLRANYARTLTGVDLDALAAQAAGLLVKRPLTRAQLARDLAAAWPAAEPMSLAYAVTYLVPVVQVPPRGIWGKNAQATWTTAESWLAEPIGPAKPEAVDALVLRYLAAFGPATVADIQTWSGLTRLREVTGRLELRAYRGPDGAELLDLPDKELPAEDVPAPPRFLPEYDNLLLSHADRRRVIPHAHPVPLWPGNGATQGTLLIDGAWDATWKITADALTITPFRRLTAAEESAITEEAAKLPRLRVPGEPHKTHPLQPRDYRVNFDPEIDVKLPTIFQEAPRQPSAACSFMSFSTATGAVVSKSSSRAQSGVIVTATICLYMARTWVSKSSQASRGMARRDACRYPSGTPSTVSSTARPRTSSTRGGGPGTSIVIATRPSACKASTFGAPGIVHIRKRAPSHRYPIGITRGAPSRPVYDRCMIGSSRSNCREIGSSSTCAGSAIRITTLSGDRLRGQRLPGSAGIIVRAWADRPASCPVLS